MDRGTPLLDLLSQSNHPNTRGHQLVATALLEWFPAPRPGEIAAANPLVRQRADPHITYHRDGWYYFTATVPEYDRLELRRIGAGKRVYMVAHQQRHTG